MWKSFFLPAVIASSFLAGAGFYKMGSQLEWWPPPTPAQESLPLETLSQAASEPKLSQEKSESEESLPETFQHLQSKNQPMTEIVEPVQIIDSPAFVVETGFSPPEEQEDIAVTEVESVTDTYDLVETDIYETDLYDAEVEVVTYPEYVQRRSIIIIQSRHRKHHGNRLHHKQHAHPPRQGLVHKIKPLPQITHVHNPKLHIKKSQHHFRHERSASLNSAVRIERQKAFARPRAKFDVSSAFSKRKELHKHKMTKGHFRAAKPKVQPLSHRAMKTRRMTSRDQFRPGARQGGSHRHQRRR